MAVNSFLSNQGTMTALLTDNTGGTAGTLIPLMKLDISSQGTAGTIWGGNVGITGGTLNTLGTLPNLPGGSVVITAGSIIQTAGTINLGTIVGKDANAAAQGGNPLGIGGTDSGGTIRTIKVDSGGLQRIGLDSGTVSVLPNIPGGTLTNLISGTINSATVVLNSGTLSVLPNLPQGSINVTAGTIATLGTMGTLGLVNTVTTVSNLSAGSVNVVAGTFIGNGGSIGANGMGANAVAAVGNPVRTGGTDSGGTTYGFLTDTAGHMKNDMLTGTVNVGTFVMPSGTVTTGSLSNVAMINAGTVVTSSGTITNSGTTTGVGSISSLGSLAMLTAGTVSMINAGTLTSITGNLGGLLTGTINAGTFRGDARTTQNILSFGTQVAFSGAAAATIVGSASVGAGTSLWVQDVSLFNMQSAAGTFILGFGTTQQGTNVLLRAPLGTSSAPGVEKPFAKAVNAGMTNQDLVLSATGAGTVDLTLSYFISV